MDSQAYCIPVALGERSYDITIKSGALGDLGKALRDLGVSGKLAIVTDRTVEPLYGPAAVRSLKSAGYEVHMFVLPAGERAKTFREVRSIVEKLAQAQFERRSVLVALGGGVIGDVAGFAAAIYMRGMTFIQVPTTLVAQVDSSVGGKTGVNLPEGKNLIGAFYQPRMVLIDPTTLKTLPKRQWRAGLAEVVKYGMIADESFFIFLEQHTDALLRMQEDSVARMIGRSCEIKADVVMEDECESNRRRILNYGHTIGHALESLGNYRMLMHGEAVAIGMIAEAELAEHLGICQAGVAARQRRLLNRLGLPVFLPAVSFPDLWAAMQHDKKVAQGRLYCVFPERVGRVQIAPLQRSVFKEWFERRKKRSEAGLEQVNQSL